MQGEGKNMAIPKDRRLRIYRVAGLNASLRTQPATVALQTAKISLGRHQNRSFGPLPRPVRAKVKRIASDGPRVRSRPPERS
jgi:hypothetical protein